MPPRPGRPGAGAYRPPHLRNTDACSSGMQQRSLDEMVPQNMLIELKYTKAGPLSLKDCPDNIMEAHQRHTQQQAAVADHDKGTADTDVGPRLACVYLQSPACPDEHQMSELLTWFARASQVQQMPHFPNGDTSAVLGLPSSLSKYERARWHAAAQRVGLASASKGLGKQRFLQIRNTHLQPDQITAVEPTGASNSASSDGSRSRSTRPTDNTTAAIKQHQYLDPSPPVARSRQVWEWCQVEGGRYWNYSQGEIKEVLKEGADMPLDLQQLIHKRELSTALCEALQQGDAASGLALLAAAPAGVKLGWVRDTASGGYPAHIAAYHGLGEVLKQLIATHGTEILQQHDARRNTPISLAQQCGHLQLAAELVQIRAQPSACTGPSSSNQNSSSPSKVDDSNCSKKGFFTSRDTGQGWGSTLAAVDDTAFTKTPATSSNLQVHKVPGQLDFIAAAAASCSAGAADDADTTVTVDYHHTVEDSCPVDSLKIGNHHGRDTKNSTHSGTAAEGSWMKADRAAQQTQRYCSYNTKRDRAYHLFGRSQGSSQFKGSKSYSEQQRGHRPNTKGW